MDTVEISGENPPLLPSAEVDSAWGQEVGMRVKGLRMERDLTQQELAQLAELSISAVSRLERGDRPPTIRILRRLAAVFNVNLQDLMGIVEP